MSLGEEKVEGERINQQAAPWSPGFARQPCVKNDPWWEKQDWKGDGHASA